MATVAEGIDDMHYAIPNLQVQASEIPVKLSTLWWRSVGHSGNGICGRRFYRSSCESGKKRSGYAFRRELLAKEPRALGVLNLAAEKI